MRLLKRSSYIAPRIWGLAEILSLSVRKKIFYKVFANLDITPKTSVLDIGVTCDQTLDSNFFEKYYPFKNKITALGQEDAFFLEEEYKGLKFVKGDACNLPFSDKEFDIAFCSAVIEHVGNRENQINLISEACRVAKIAIITTPNKFFPLEFHTLSLFIHWMPKFFRIFLRLTGRYFFSKEENLNLLSDNEIKDIINKLGYQYKIYHHRLLGLRSNLVYLINT